MNTDISTADVINGARLVVREVGAGEAEFERGVVEFVTVVLGLTEDDRDAVAAMIEAPEYTRQWGEG